MRVLDLGCGAGLTPEKLSLPATWQFIGLDDNYASVSQAHLSFPRRAFVCAAGGGIAVSSRELWARDRECRATYMNIATTLAEAHRVLAPGGTLLASLHPLTFTVAEFRKALPQPKPSLYRLLVIANGIAFHVAGRNFGEAFQTERGIRIALRRANFAAVSFRHESKR